MDRKETGVAHLLRFPARLDAVPGAMSFAAMALQQAGLGPSVVARAELILEELLRNSILHGHGGDSAHSVWVGVEGALLVYEDEAPAFDPLTQGPPPPDPVRPVEDQQVGGIGLLLIRQLGSAVAYRYSGGRNRIEIVLQ
ncbi:ATP-binding protein [Rugamonas rivuli]|uniref:ATP-binding protein n=1 Tax=Rugamonas rivuli TaxID=2743358 RepID=A0A843S819_9BURK|nr:ATP-binding protein [Rugamonas rivuli]MQA18314.1 ATP-binding protein [Rugamonas rivuli]